MSRLKCVDVDGTELRHVTGRGRSDAEGSFAVNNDQSDSVITVRLLG